MLSRQLKRYKFANSWAYTVQRFKFQTDKTQSKENDDMWTRGQLSKATRTNELPDLFWNLTGLSS
jgi:hypothetical protein